MSDPIPKSEIPLSSGDESKNLVFTWVFDLVPYEQFNWGVFLLNFLSLVHRLAGLSALIHRVGIPL